MARKAQQIELIPATTEERTEREFVARERAAQTVRETPPSYVEVWVVTYNTPKHPGCYVMNRRFLFHGTQYMPKSTAEESKVVVSENIEEVRKFVPYGMFRLVPKDDAVTVEIWI